MGWLYDKAVWEFLIIGGPGSRSDIQRTLSDVARPIFYSFVMICVQYIYFFVRV